MGRYFTAVTFIMASKQLLLLRHAKSDWSSDAGSDFERPLSARGRHDAPRMGRWLADNDHLPDAVVGSPSARTTETIELVCAALGYDVERVIYDRRLYHASGEQIREIADAQLERRRRVLVVAHNPGMESALLAYCPATEAFDDGKLMPTCALAVIEWGGDGGGDAHLRALMRPSLL